MATAEMEYMSPEFYDPGVLSLAKMEDYDGPDLLLGLPPAAVFAPDDSLSSVDPSSGDSPPAGGRRRPSSTTAASTAADSGAARRPASARRRKRAASPGPDAEAKRRLNRERNRQAASRCRQNKKEQNRLMNERQISLKAENDLLRDEVRKEKELRDSLVRALEAHRHCGDPNIALCLPPPPSHQHQDAGAAAPPAGPPPPRASAAAAAAGLPLDLLAATPVPPQQQQQQHPGAAYPVLAAAPDAAAALGEQHPMVPPQPAPQQRPRPLYLPLQPMQPIQPMQAMQSMQPLAINPVAAFGATAAGHDEPRSAGHVRTDSLQSTLSSAPSSYAMSTFDRAHSVTRRSSAESSATSLQSSPFGTDDALLEDKHALDAVDADDWINDLFDKAAPTDVSASLF